MKYNYDMTLLESMILSNKIRLTEASGPCILPDDWNQEKGDAFRAWFNKQYPSKSAELDLDPTGPFDNATIKSAFCWKPDGLETTGDKYLNTAGDEPMMLSGWPVRYYLIAAAALVVATGVGFVWWYKARRATRLAKAVIDGIKNYKGDKAELLHDTITSLNSTSKRQSIIQRIIKGDKKNQLTTTAEKEQIKQLANNPAAFEKTIDELHKLYLQEFKLGNLTADEYIRAVRMNPNSAEAKALKVIERAKKKSGNKGYWPSKNDLKKMRDRLKSNASKSKEKTKLFKPVISNPTLTYMAVGDDVANTWFIFKGNISKDSIDTAYRRALNNVNLGMKTAIMIKSGPGPSSLFKELNGNGKRLLAKHANAEKFPTLNQWTIEMNKAGASPQVSPGDISRYVKNLALWHLVNKPI